MSLEQDKIDGDNFQFFYDEQIRRYLLQFVRIFTAFSYKTGKDSTGTSHIRRVPARYALRDRMVGTILRNNSENTILATPFITAWISDLSMSDNRRQFPYHVERQNVHERDIDPTTNQYTGDPGDTYTVERYMPIPYNLTMQVDIWTSNEQIKHQLLEQILILFNPSIQLQSSTNPLDWTSLTHVVLNDVTWTSRTIPIGTDEEIDISTLTFEVPIWLSPPAKVKRMNMIRTIRQNINEVSNIENLGIEKIPDNQGDTGNLGSVIVKGYTVFISGDSAILLGENGNTFDNDGNPFDWQDVFNQYGKMQPGITQLRLIVQDDVDATEKDIVGSVQFDGNNVNRLIWMPDPSTLPENTLDSVDGIIDPRETFPTSDNSLLPPASSGQRYLLEKSIQGPTEAWGDLTANENDIIYFDGQKWKIPFSSTENTGTVEHVLNKQTQKQLKWTGKEWIIAIDGFYDEGEWRIFLNGDS